MQYFPFLQNCMYFCPEIKQKKYDGKFSEIKFK